MKSTTPIVGYNSGDYFYANPEYCSKTCSSNYCQYTSKDGIDNNGNYSNKTPETTYTGTENSINNTNACSANEYYAKKIKSTTNETNTTETKYKIAVEAYNRELITTVNYILGVSVLFGYIYVNNLLLPS